MTTHLIPVSLPVQIGEDRDETGEVVKFYVPVLISADGPKEDEADRWLDINGQSTPRVSLLEKALRASRVARSIDVKAAMMAREQFDREQREGQTP